ncbi:methionyl-tRNA formyltransferase [Spirochaetia bacterium]|nr:methionyl-tRNA formyltransferase [Spirochaetia bacterium]
MIRIIFAASPAIAVPALIAMANMALKGECVFLALLTNADSAKGRSKTATPTEAAAACTQVNERFAVAGIPPILQLKPQRLDAALYNEVAALKPDLLVSFAYGTIFTGDFLKLFPLGGINIHPSLLPKYRGPTPIQAAILSGDTRTGLCIQRLANGIDSGDILAQETVPLNGRETSESLSLIMAEKAAALLPPTIISIIEHKMCGVPQSGDVSYCKKIEKACGAIDWRKSAVFIDAQVRAFTPWPLCRTLHGGLPLFILEGGSVEEARAADNGVPAGAVLGIDKKKGILIKCGEGIYAARRLQYEARKALDWKSFLNGAKNFTQAVLG